MNIKPTRPFVTATVTISFVIVSITGLLMAFHLLPKAQSHMMKGLHEWLSYLFIIGAFVHLYFNWTVIKGYFKQKQTHLQWITAGAICVILMATVLAVKPESAHKPNASIGGNIDRIKHHFERHN
ncbi:MAG: DUF4405 domain-containing protein [Chlorobiales bacterium]|nr:DUF4405 domain-containing protein [Chlorobiales bacterium]